MIAAACRSQRSAVHRTITVVTALFTLSQTSSAGIGIGIQTGVAGTAECSLGTVIPIGIAADITRGHAAIAALNFPRRTESVGAAARIH
jgi:hypothetical protein